MIFYNEKAKLIVMNFILFFMNNPYKFTVYI